jgi:hypothetical protein
LSVNLIETCTPAGTELVPVIAVTAVVEVDTVDTTVTVDVAVNTPPNAENLSIVDSGVL